MTTNTIRAYGTLAIALSSACGSASHRNDAGGTGGARDAGGAGGTGTGGAGGAGGSGGAGGAPIPHGYSLPELTGGTPFYIRLPPKFAPFLPLSGDEETREPPGFYDPTSPNYFSYGFLWWLTGTPDLSTAALRDNIRDYYTGLCGLSAAAAVTLDEPADAPDAGTLAARRNGTLKTGMCFNMPVPDAIIEVSTYNCPDHAAVIVLVLSQPTSSQIWTDLRNVRDGFSCW